MKTLNTFTVYSVERQSWWRSKTDKWVVFKREAKRYGPDRVSAKEYADEGKHLCILGASRAHGLPELAHQSTRERLELKVKQAEEELATAKSILASLPPLGELEVIETKLPT